ncbi:MAG: hypothetical protein FWE69_07310, partial [Clostridiales bacterium]|nr:hypothetical protein [Clostridiales bacterium]
EALRLQKKIDKIFSDALGSNTPINVSGTPEGDLRIRLSQYSWVVLKKKGFSIGNIAFIGEYSKLVETIKIIQETAVKNMVGILELLISYNRGGDSGNHDSDLESEIEELIESKDFLDSFLDLELE